MTNGVVYVLDANVLIEAKRRYYAFDLAPGFWESLEAHAENGTLKSIDHVQDELERGHDNLADWATGDFSEYFDSTDDPEVIEQYQRVMEWVNAQGQYLDAAKAEFADGADGWLIAYAMTRGCTVVTHERPNPNIRRKVPIPNVCRVFDVEYMDTFDMLRALRVQFGRRG